MDNAFILTLLIGVVLLAFFVAPVLIGISVYKHAVIHHVKNPYQWALISGLTPLYIGLVIYAIKFESMEKVD
jgi:hypothetical protein